MVKNLKILVLTLSLSLSLLTMPVLADEINVGFGGVYTSGNNFENYQRNRNNVNKNFKDVLFKLNEEKKLPFNIIFDTDSEGIKTNINNDNPYSMAVLMTRDDINKETFSNNGISVNKSYINVGIVALIYQTVDDLKEKGKKKNSIIYSFPIVGYSINLSSGDNDLSIEALDKSFLQVAKSSFENEIVKKLQDISMDKLKGEILSHEENNYKISLGSSKGLIKGQRVKFINSDKTSNISGKIISIDKDFSVIETSEKVPESYTVETTNIKGLSDDTYQVVDFKISSEKCRKWFDSKIIGIQASQWFSDFLSSRGGKVVLPSKVGTKWIESANEQSYALFIKDGKEHVFEVAKPKYSIILDITGLSDKKIEEESNNISENWIYKIWFNVEIPEKKYSKEFDMVTTKNVVVGSQEFQEKAEIFNLLHQITAKSAKEIELND